MEQEVLMEDNQNIEEQNILPKMDRELLAEMEQSMEDDFKREYQQEDVTSILDSIEYIRIYCRNFPLFNGDDYQPLQAPFAYYRSRSTYLKEVPFTEDEFYNFTLIQEAINKLGLLPQPTFEFIVFLYHIIKVWSESQITTGIDKVNSILSLLEEQPNTKLKIEYQSKAARTSSLRTLCSSIPCLNFILLMNRFHTILWSERTREYESALSNILWSRHC